jgi:hypothetical protein
MNPIHILPTSLRTDLMLFFHLRLCLKGGLHSTGFRTKLLYSFMISPMRSTWPIEHILLDCITLIIFGEEYKSRSSSLRSFLQPPVTCVPVTNILLSTLFKNILNLCSSLNVRDQVSPQTKQQAKLIFTFWDGKSEDSELNCSKYSRNLISS